MSSFYTNFELGYTNKNDDVIICRIGVAYSIS